MVGTVREESSLGRPNASTDPLADEFLGLTIEVETVLAGDPVDDVTMAWDAYVVDADGSRTAANVMNGVPVPHVGDRLVLFLRPVDEQFGAAMGGFPTHAPVALDGVAFLDRDTVTLTDETATQAAHLTGMTIAQIVSEL